MLLLFIYLTFSKFLNLFRFSFLSYLLLVCCAFPDHRAIFCYLPRRSLFVADFFPIRNCTDFECNLVNRAVQGLRTIAGRFYGFTCCLLSFIPDLFNRFLTPQTNCIDCGFVVPRMRQQLFNSTSLFMITLIRLNTILMGQINYRLHQIRYSSLCFSRLFARSGSEPQTEVDT